MFKFFLISLFLVFSNSLCLYANTKIIEKTIEVETDEKNTLVAKRILIEKANQSVSEGLIKEIIGEEKFVKNRIQIYSKIIKNAPKYIPYSKNGELLGTAETGYRMIVNFKVNTDDLQKMLLNLGLFYDDELPVVVAFVRFYDQVNNKKFSWWSEDFNIEDSFLIKGSRIFESVLKSSFGKNYFYIVRSQRYNWKKKLPEEYYLYQLRPEVLKNIGQYFKATMLVDGEVIFQKIKERQGNYQILINLTVLQVINGRMIAAVSRTIETEAGSFELSIDRKMREAFEVTTQELSTQVLDVWQKGELGASLYRLTVRGGLGLLQQEQFKEVVKANLMEIKSIRERLISKDAVVYEVDMTLNPQELGRKMPEIDLSGAKFVLDSIKEGEIIYKASGNKASENKTSGSIQK